MTLCVYNGKQLMMDRAITVPNEGINYSMHKYASHSDGLLTGCGNAGTLNILFRMFNRLGKNLFAHKKFDALIDAADTTVMYIAADGSCFLFFDKKPFEAIPPVAIGSGAAAALGALSAGAKITELTKIVNGFVPSVSADYDLVTLKNYGGKK